MAILYGVPVSPYVRKVMLAHDYKKVSYELKLTPPGSDEPEFVAVSPLKKIPAYKTDNGFGFADSTIIIAYLEKTVKQNRLYPDNADLYAKALWLEEYSDTKMSEAISALYFQRFVGPKFFNHTTDEKRVTELLTELIPQVLNYIESQLILDEWAIGNEFSIADIAIGMNLISLFLVDYEIDKEQYPKLSTFNKRFMALDLVVDQLAKEATALTLITSK